MSVVVAVLASGGGSNLQALLDRQAELGDRCRYRVALVIVDRASAGALERARRAGVDTHVLADHRDGATLASLLDSCGASVVVLAGYLRLVPEAVTNRWVGRVVNVHPALLPAFGGAGMYGRRVHEAVIASGARVSGATVHLVDEVYDRGRILAQWPVPVFPHDTPESLASRVLRVEHVLLPAVVEWLAEEQHHTSAGTGAFVDGSFSLRADPRPDVSAIRSFATGETRTNPIAPDQRRD